MHVHIHSSWKKLLQPEFKKPYFKKLVGFVNQEYLSKTIFPPKSEIFAAFNLCNFDNIKVVILGQDPYHGINQAQGLCFSVNPGVNIPPSLKNIYKELLSDINKPIPDHGDLRSWAKQGVLLINSTMTVRQKSPASHQKQGWEEFTDSVIKTISQNKQNIVFLLWGNFAKSKANLIDNKKHLILTAAHPSPFSAHNGFFGCKHFSKTNSYLKSTGQDEIVW